MAYISNYHLFSPVQDQLFVSVFHFVSVDPWRPSTGDVRLPWEPLDLEQHSTA